MHASKTLRCASLLVVSILFAASTQAAAQAGQLDPTFGQGGIVTTDFGIQLGQANIATANAVTIQPDGKIVVSGAAPTSSGFPTAAVARYNTDGSLDTGFGSSGVAVTPNLTALTAVALQTDGKIVAVCGGGITIDVVRYSTDGSLDTTFGSGGIAAISALPGGTSGVGVEPDGKIVVASGFHLLRLLPDGASDPTFGSGSGTGVKLAGDSATALALLANGKIQVASALGASDNEASGFVTRYTSNGSLDASFGINGQMATSGPANAMVLLSTGEFLIGGSVISSLTALNGGFGPSTGFAVSRYQGAGVTDGKFGSHGGTLTALSASPNVNTSGLGVQSSGDIVVLGTPANIESFGFGLARYTPTGQLDTTFGSNGTVITAFGTDFVNASALAIQSDGKIVAVGSYRTSGQNNFDYGYKLARYLGQ
jgi:uncharacterized delta-60 repeat protein